MDDWETGVYIHEIINQCEAVELAVNGFNSALQANSSGSVPLAFANVQSILAASAMLSKLLWPQPSARDRDGNRLTGEAEQQRLRTVQRGRSLRTLLIVGSDNTQPLEDNRTVRNSFEHFDERLDAFIYMESQGSRNIVDRNIVPLGAIVMNGSEPKHLRRIDPQTVSVSVLDDKVDLQPLVNLVQAVKSRATSWLENHRFPERGR